MHTYIHTYIRVCVYTYTRTYTCAHRHAHTSASTCVYMYFHKNTHVHTCMLHTTCAHSQRNTDVYACSHSCIRRSILHTQALCNGARVYTHAVIHTSVGPYCTHKLYALALSKEMSKRKAVVLVCAPYSVNTGRVSQSAVHCATEREYFAVSGNHGRRVTAPTRSREQVFACAREVCAGVCAGVCVYVRV